MKTRILHWIAKVRMSMEHGHARMMGLPPEIPSQTEPFVQSQTDQFIPSKPRPKTPPRPSDPVYFKQWPATKPFLLLLDDADTLVYVDFPLQLDGSRLSHRTATVPHRVHSEKLLATGSTYFERLFSPPYQAAFKKQRRLPDNLSPGIKYVLDLTPPLLGDDALILMTDLSCPDGIREWASQMKAWDLPESCVGGVDEMEPVAEETDSLSSTSEQVFGPCKQNCENCLMDHDFSDYCFSTTDPQLRELITDPLPLEYSPKRHRDGIEYILHALMGFDPILDTPCKLWTFVGLAKFFDIATVPAISGPIVSWFYELNNVRIIKLHPEVAYHVACATKSSRLCREAFTELVVDAALLVILRMAGFKPAPHMAKLIETPARDVLDDVELQRIEYASKTFADFVLCCFVCLAGQEMAWLRHLGDFQKLVRHLELHPDDGDLINPIIQVFKEHIRDRIFGALLNVRDKNRALQVDPRLGKFAYLYHRYLDRRSPDLKYVVQRLIGKDFWKSLRSLDLNEESPFHITHPGTVASICLGSSTIVNETDAVLRRVYDEEIFAAIRIFNHLSAERLQQRIVRDAAAAEVAS